MSAWMEAQPTRGAKTSTSDGSGSVIPGLLMLLLFVGGGIVFLIAQRASKKRVEQARARAQQQYHAAWYAEQQRQASIAAEADARLRAQWQQHEQRRAHLTARFGAATAERVMRGEFWMGQTREQLVEALGPPVETEQRVLKTKKKETFKYVRTGVNRFGLRITLDDDMVVGWEDKR